MAEVQPTPAYTDIQGEVAASVQNRDLTEGQYLTKKRAKWLDLALCLVSAGSGHRRCCNRYTPKSVSTGGVVTVYTPNSVSTGGVVTATPSIIAYTNKEAQLEEILEV